MTTVYDDAEVQSHHGELAGQALVVALARFASNMAAVLAREQGVTTAEWLDRFERHKAEQHAFEEDED